MPQNRIKTLHHNGNPLKQKRRCSNIPGRLHQSPATNSLKNWRASLLIGPWDSTAIGTNSPCDDSPAYLSFVLLLILRPSSTKPQTKKRCNKHRRLLGVNERCWGKAIAFNSNYLFLAWQLSAKVFGVSAPSIWNSTVTWLSLRSARQLIPTKHAKDRTVRRRIHWILCHNAPPIRWRLTYSWRWRWRVQKFW